MSKKKDLKAGDKVLLVIPVTVSGDYNDNPCICTAHKGSTTMDPVYANMVKNFKGAKVIHLK